MRLNTIFWVSWATATLVLGSGIETDNEIRPRQDGSASGLPTLGSGNSITASASATSNSPNSNTQSGTSASNTASPAPTASGSMSSRIGPSQTTNITSSMLPSSSPPTILPNSSPTMPANTTGNTTTTDDDTLPLEPRVTPAFAIAGVFLILTGTVYTVIGVKNRWVHTFLSTAYLTSLSIAVLIVYVLNPPVSDAIQGAYFVGIFMTGVIFGAGALIFKEVTEGLGCLLGGFCLSMWFLTLKEGGLIDSTGGKAIFISVFCVVSWSLSFSHYTRAYGLMVSIAFSGATAFVLGIDCFSRGGLKEFWVYLWDLNDNIFPLNTNTYPISRGTRVETIIIIPATIIGIISQMKLWKIVKDRQKQKDEAKTEEVRRRDAVEAALGRHLEKQNDRDRSQWEKQYGDRLNAKRETVLWTDAHGEKGYSKIKETELRGSQNSASMDSLEMSNMSRQPRSMYVTRIKRNSMPITAISEVDENEVPGDKTLERQKVLDQLEGNSSTTELPTESNTIVSSGATLNNEHTKETIEDGTRDLSATNSIADAQEPRTPTTNKRQSAIMDSEIAADGKRNSDYQKHLAAPEEGQKKKRRSFASFLSRSRDDDDKFSSSPSQEALVIPQTPLRHSRASSLAATFDFENEDLELPTIDVDFAEPHRMPEIIVSPAGMTQHDGVQANSTIRDQPQEPELEEQNSDVDLEEFVRPTAPVARTTEEKRISSGTSLPTRRQSGAEFGTEAFSEDATKSKAAASEVPSNEVLTKGALELMPSQLSHVVMSYRTNEWAKHISTADVPMVEEPEPIQEHQIEAPTHLADPQSLPESRRTSLNKSLPVPPEVPAPVPSALPSTSEGIRINPALQHEQTLISPVVQPTVTQPPPTRSSSDAKSIPRGFRSTSTPMLVKQAIQGTAIDENNAANFAPRQPTIARSASSQSIHNHNMTNSPLPNRPSTAHTNYPTLARSTSRLSMVSENGVVPARANSMLSSYQPMPMAMAPGSYASSQIHLPYQHQHHSNSPYLPQQQPPARSDTRLPFYDSHQPLRRNESSEQLRREAMFSEWRTSQAHPQPTPLSRGVVVPEQVDAAEFHRRQMLAERQQVKFLEEQQKNHRWQQEMVVDARMRSKDMQELHREAMRRMQAGVKKI